MGPHTGWHQGNVGWHARVFASMECREVVLAEDALRIGNAGALHAHSSREHGTRYHTLHPRDSGADNPRAFSEGGIIDHAEKCNEGTLSAEERAEYEDYVRVINSSGSSRPKPGPSWSGSLGSPDGRRNTEVGTGTGR